MAAVNRNDFAFSASQNGVGLIYLLFLVVRKRDGVLVRTLKLNQSFDWLLVES